MDEEIQLKELGNESIILFCFATWVEILVEDLHPFSPEDTVLLKPNQRRRM